MTAKEIYEAALSNLFEYPDKDADFKAFFPDFLNLLMQEALPTENAVREARGEELLVSAPVVTDLTEEGPYDDMITRVAFPYGVAALYLRDDMDNFNAQDYRARYIGALQDAIDYAFKYRTGEGIVQDVYRDVYLEEAD